MSRSDRLVALALFVAGSCLGAALFLRAPPGAKPSIHDEFAYLLQAKMLASGHLTYPSPPLPEFFEAAHVLVVPRYGAKYLPGHAAVLAPFVAAGVPWLGPSLLLGLTLALAYLAARLAALPRWAGLAAAGLLLGSSELDLTFGTYLSETTSVALVTAAIAAATWLRARPTPARTALLFACAGAAALVRPFAGAALAVAAAFWLVGLRPRPWPRFAAAALLPMAATAFIAGAVCRTTTGSWTVTPWGLYARQYMPFDGPGLGAPREQAAERRVPAHLAPMVEGFRASRARYTWTAFPQEVLRRGQIVEDLAPSLLVLPFVALGVLCTPLVFASVFTLVFFAFQLTFHAAFPFYYLETCPWLALLGAAGAALVVRKVDRLVPRWKTAAALIPVLLAGLQAGMEGASNVRYELARSAFARSAAARCDAVFAWLGERRALVFLRYPPGWNANVDLGYNEPDLRRADLVRALDLGPRNAELLGAFPERPAYRLDLATLALTRLQ